MFKKSVNFSLIKLITLIPYLYFSIYTFHSFTYILSILKLSVMLNYNTLSSLNARLNIL
jgi:hypothetical protein